MSITANYFEPSWASPPGETISDLLHERGMTIGQLALKMKQSEENISRLLSGEESLSNDVANQLTMIFGGSPEFWRKRQVQYDEDLRRLKSQSESSWLKGLPIKDMIRFGWIKETKDKLAASLDYFDVADLHAWEKKYSQIIGRTAFRKSNSFVSEVAAVAAWLRQGEIRGGKIKCDKWSADKFEKALFRIKPLTRKKNPQEFLPILIEECAKSGVAIVVVPTPSGCRASGATKFISNDKALLMLSFRYLSDDQFWFTFFHEAGHVLMHSKEELFLEGVHEDLIREQEAEANAFAGDHLIPHDLHPELAKLKSNKRDIISFAIKAGVSPGIVVGQMQHYDYVSKKYLNGFKRRYSWDNIPLD